MNERMSEGSKEGRKEGTNSSSFEICQLFVPLSLIVGELFKFKFNVANFGSLLDLYFKVKIR